MHILFYTVIAYSLIYAVLPLPITHNTTSSQYNTTTNISLYHADDDDDDQPHAEALIGRALRHVFTDVVKQSAKGSVITTIRRGAVGIVVRKKMTERLAKKAGKGAAKKAGKDAAKKAGKGAAKKVGKGSAKKVGKGATKKRFKPRRKAGSKIVRKSGKGPGGLPDFNFGKRGIAKLNIASKLGKLSMFAANVLTAILADVKKLVAAIVSAVVSILSIIASIVCCAKNCACCKRCRRSSHERFFP